MDEKPTAKWIMTEDQRNRLITLATEIADSNQVRVSITMDFEYMDLSFMADTAGGTIEIDDDEDNHDSRTQ